MPETLLGSSNILLYGRRLLDLNFQYHNPRTPAPQPSPGPPVTPPDRVSNNNFLEQQMSHPDALLARIYGFSYEGHYYDLAKPAIFLVHGDGDDPEDPRPPPGQERVSRAPSDADRTGVSGESGSFSEDMRVWPYDKGDFSIRLDVETGPFEDILLDMELRTGMQGTHYSGAEARIRTSGAEARVRTSGAEARIRTSGAEARSRG